MTKLKYFVSITLCFLLFPVICAQAGISSTTLPSPSRVASSLAAPLAFSSPVKISPEGFIVKSKLSTHNRKIMGDITEKLADNFFQGKGKYTKVKNITLNSGQGIDSMYVRKLKSGRYKVMVVESKFQGGQLNQSTSMGAQMSDGWIKKNIDKKIKELERTISRSKKDIQKLRSSREIRKVNNTIKLSSEQMKLLNKIKNGPFHKRLLKMKVDNGWVKFDIQGIEERFSKTRGVNLEPKKLPQKASNYYTKSKSCKIGLCFPLESKEFNKLKKALSDNPKKLRYFKNLRNNFTKTTLDGLKKSGVKAREAKELLGRLSKGELNNTKAWNQALDEAKINSNLSAKDKALFKKYKGKFGSRFIVKELFKTKADWNIIRKNSKYVASSLKAGGTTKLRAKTARRSFKTKTKSYSLKKILRSSPARSGTMKVVGASARIAGRAIIVFAIAYEGYQQYKHIKGWMNGTISTENLIIFEGGTVGALAGAIALGWAGTKLGVLACSWTGIGAGACGIAGGILGGIAGGVLGHLAGQKIAKAGYSMYKSLKEEEHQKEYLYALHNYVEAQ